MEVARTRWKAIAEVMTILLLIGYARGQNRPNVDAVTLTEEIRRRPELSRFLGWLQRSRMDDTYSGQTRFTVFAPNNTAFEMLPAARLQQIEFNSTTLRSYIETLAMHGTSFMTNDMRDNSIQQSYGSKTIYIATKQREDFSGVTQYFVNGARIVDENIYCVNGMLHVLDVIPEKPSLKPAFDYIQLPDITSLQTRSFYDLLMDLPQQHYRSIADLKTAKTVTLFVPSNAAIGRIPAVKLNELRMNPDKLNQVITRHYIKDHVIMTSWVRHRQSFHTESPIQEEQIVFRKRYSEGTEQVFVNSEGVTAMITYGNITLGNGVIHMVDQLLGYVYYSAMEQIEGDATTTQFAALLLRTSQEIQNVLRNLDSRQVTVFVPNNAAFSAISNLPWIDLNSNATLRDMIARYHILFLGQEFEIVTVNGEYESRVKRLTMYQNAVITVYNRYDVTYAEAGYVRARIVRPDIGVTNGYVQYVDRIFGVPTHDVAAIVCDDDWLFTTFNTYLTVGVLPELLDCRLARSQVCEPQLRTLYTNFKGNVPNQPCNSVPPTYSEQYTLFVPNGSVIDFFERSLFNKPIWSNNDRYSLILRRHMIPNRLIFLDRLGSGRFTYRSATNDDIIVIKSDYGQFPRYDVSFGNKKVRVLHSDLGATNGVVHIVSDLLYISDDLTRPIQGATSAGVCTLLLLFCLGFIVAVK